MKKMTQKNYEAIKIYRQKEQIFELKGQIQQLKEKVKELEQKDFNQLVEGQALVDEFGDFNALHEELQRLREENRKLSEQRILDIMALKTWKKDYGQLRQFLKECQKAVNENYQQVGRINDCPRSTTAFWQIESSKIGLERILDRINEVLK